MGYIKRSNGGEAWRNLATYSALSLNLGVMVLGGYYLGLLIEKQFNLSNMRVTGLLVGLGLGLYEMFTVALRVAKKK